jgi:hypothetical protein
MNTIPAVVVGDVGEVAHPAVQSQQVERSCTNEIDRHLVGAEQMPYLGDVPQRHAEAGAAYGAYAASVPTLTSGPADVPTNAGLGSAPDRDVSLMVVLHFSLS